MLWLMSTPEICSATVDSLPFRATSEIGPRFVPDGVLSLFDNFQFAQLPNNIGSAGRRDAQTVCPTRPRNLKIFIAFVCGCSRKSVRRHASVIKQRFSLLLWPLKRAGRQMRTPAAISDQPLLQFRLGSWRENQERGNAI